MLRSMAIEFRTITSRADWLSWRPAFLGASEVPAVAGIDPYRSAMTVYAEKLGLLNAQNDSAPMKRGRWLEHAAFAGLVEENPGVRFVQPNTFVIDHDLRLACTPDVLSEDDDGLVNIQVKCTSPGVFEDWDGVPLNYQLQTICEGMLLDASRSLLVVLVADSYSVRLEYSDIPRHPEAEARIRELAAGFWADVAEGKMPRPDYGRDRDAIRAIYRPDPDAPPLDLRSDNRIYELLEEREFAKSLIKQGEEACSRVEAEIVHKLDGAPKAFTHGWRISNKIIHAKEYHVAEREYPRLTVTKTKE